MNAYTQGYILVKMWTGIHTVTIADIVVDTGANYPIPFGNS